MRSSGVGSLDGLDLALFLLLLAFCFEEDAVEAAFTKILALVQRDFKEL
jgi:hypothetical protein